MVVQIALVYLLASNIKQLEQCYNGEVRAADYLGENVKFLAQLIACAGAQAMYQVSREPKYELSFRNKVQAATIQSDILRAKAKPFLGERKESKELEDLFLSLKQASERGSQAAQSQDQIDQAVAFMELRGILNRVNGVTGEMMSRLTDARRSIALSKLETQGRIYAIIYATIAANVIILILFILRFDRTTSERFAHLTENVMSLGANQPLKYRIEGKDDIVELDSVIHRVSNVLRDSRLKEQAIVEQAVDVICALDEKGKFQQINPAAQRLWKFESDEILGKSLTSLVAPEEKERVQRTISQVVSSEGITTFETNVVTRDNQRVEMQWNTFFSQEMKQIFCVAHDVTERKKLERMKAQLVEMITHDLRSPMSALQITLNILSSGSIGEMPEGAQQRLKRAELSLSQMVDLLDDFLELEKIDSSAYVLDKNETSAREVLDLSCSLIGELATKKNIVIQTDSQEFSCLIDKARFVRVITNLLSNAIKFSPENSTIKVVAAKRDSSAVFEVIDEGPGIEKEEQENLFQRFAQTQTGKKQSKGGVGLGLSVCKAIVQAHGGTIWVESDLGKGSKFVVSVPCAG